MALIEDIKMIHRLSGEKNFNMKQDNPTN